MLHSWIFILIHTNEFIQLLYKLYYEFVHSVVFVPIHTIFIRIIVRIHTRCDFFILFLSLRKPRANDNDQINYLAIRKGSSRCFIRIRISNSYKSVRSAKTFKSEKVGLPPLPRYVGTCKNMYKKILATFRKSGLYSLTRVAYSQPQYTNLQISVSCLCECFFSSTPS